MNIWRCMNDWWVLNMMFIIMWCIFSFTWIVRIIRSCWITMVMLLVFIYVMCIYVVDEFSYMLLCWIVGVSMYWNMLAWIVEVVWKYALLLLSYRSTHCWCRISYSCWWQILCIQLFGLIIQVVYDVQLASGVTTSEVIWYHTCLESV